MYILNISNIYILYMCVSIVLLPVTLDINSILEYWSVDCDDIVDTVSLETTQYNLYINYNLL